MPIAPKSSRSIARASQDPMPGSVMVVFPTVIASDATTKNQAPDIDIIMFQTSAGSAKGSSSRTKRRHAEKPNCRETSSRSPGTVRSD